MTANETDTRLRAIIVEDEFLAAIHAETALEELGVEVIGTAEDTVTALQLAQMRPNLALVDLNLRDGFTGPSVAHQLARSGINVVFVTANPSEALANSFIQATVLEKPIEEALLANVISSLAQKPVA